MVALPVPTTTRDAMSAHGARPATAAPYATWPTTCSPHAAASTTRIDAASDAHPSGTVAARRPTENAATRAPSDAGLPPAASKWG